ncbi:MAG: hypothetical protein HQL75_18300 [Magnetococcales bacterium]|nr:hypothetical protein [Magnetococcales bacterium]
MNIERFYSCEDIDRETVRRWAIESLDDPLALSFSHYVSSNVDWGSAWFRTFGSSDLSKEDYLNFETGGKFSGTPYADDWLIESIKVARKQESTFLFIEDWTARPGSCFISSFLLPAVYSGNEVYYVVEDRDFDQMPRWGRISSNTSPLFHGFVIQDYPAPSLGSTLEKEDLEAISRHVLMAFLGIYDGESYMLCSFE